MTNELIVVLIAIIAALIAILIISITAYEVLTNPTYSRRKELEKTKDTELAVERLRINNNLNNRK